VNVRDADAFAEISSAPYRNRGGCRSGVGDSDTTRREKCGHTCPDRWRLLVVVARRDSETYRDATGDPGHDLGDEFGDQVVEDGIGLSLRGRRRGGQDDDEAAHR
jgi:hypothetical protein